MINDDIIKIPDGINASLIIRHAERYPITNMELVSTPLLTEKGKNDSYLFGKELQKFKNVKMFHSPVERCRETSMEISRGIRDNNYDSEIMGHASELGGPYIVGDWKDIVKEINRYGYNNFISMWIKGGIPPSLVMPIREAADLTVKYLINQLMDNNCSIINVTHDWNIIILREHFFNPNYEDMGIPDYLDGMLLYLNDRKPKIVYRGIEKQIDFTFN